MTAIQAARKACTETVMREQTNGDLKQEARCLPQDVAVVAYIVDGIDRATGECTRHYATIGKGCGMSRSAVGRSIKRLVDAGIVRRVPRQARNGAQISTAFILPSRPANGTPPTHQRDTYKEESSHSLQYPDGKPSEQIDVKEPRKHQTRSKVDWSEVEEWLWVQVNYEKLYSDASRSDAEIELRHLRKHIGDFALARAVENAKKFKLYGTPLLDFRKNTKPDRTVTGEEGET